jgi:predicted transcriptional regulator
MATTTLGIKVDKATQARLQALAKAKDRSPHWVLRRALAEYLEREEQRERERHEDEERWDRALVIVPAIFLTP